MKKLQFAERLKILRMEWGLTQEKLSDALDTTQRKISYWEAGKTEPDLTSLWKIADFFDVPIDVLIGRRDF